MRLICTSSKNKWQPTTRRHRDISITGVRFADLCLSVQVALMLIRYYVNTVMPAVRRGTKQNNFQLSERVAS